MAEQAPKTTAADAGEHKEAPAVLSQTDASESSDAQATKKEDTSKSTTTEGTPVAGPASASLIANDSPAQTGASMGEHCITDRPTPDGETSTGEISRIADVDVYISKPDGYPQSPSKLLLLLSSGTGIHSVNNQVQADHFAREGFLTVMPDQFGGDSAPSSATHPVDESDTSVLEQIKMRAVDTVQSFKIDMWLARQTPEKILPVLQNFVTGAKEEFADAVANGGGIFVVGYCIGAKYALLLSSELPDTAAHGQQPDSEPGVVVKASDVKAVAIAHGTMIVASDFANLRAPITIVAAENDPLFPQELQEAGLKALEENKISHATQTYSGVQHGFAVVGEYKDEHVQKSQKDAFKQIIDWLKVH